MVRLLLATSSFLLSPSILAGEPQQSPASLAQQRLPHFLKVVAERPSWASRFRVLVALRDNQEEEQFWVNDFRKDGDSFSARLETIPRKVTNVKLGQRVAVMPESILDWTYEHPATRWITGHFHVCSELSASPPDEAREQREYWRLECNLEK